jgi:YHS domain-containing protein
MRAILISALVVILSCCTGDRNEIFSTVEGAIQGYDAVSYFADSSAVKGIEDFQFEWNDATWYFSSAANLNMFKSAPDKYAPQYGGYCAYGTADGHKAPTDPQAWAIVNNKLYLNYNKDVQRLWLKEQSKFIEKADINWPDVKHQKF